MSMRNTSGKFSLSSFGRKVSGMDRPSSPTKDSDSNEEGHSPVRESHGVGFDGLGKKLKGSLAHNNLLPALGHKDLRALQDIISSEKGVLQMFEKLAAETNKASSSLPPYGTQEGPDLQDILTQSSKLLSKLTTALNVFARHQAEMRVCLKRVREREEALMELKNRRKSTGTKAETAERKLAKMGPENKSLPHQTELLERLRSDMRQMDQDITTEETKIGDFKRQTLKEALSYKFGGLEELGEKMCIIGELGKLLLEEVPLEETPVGYGRAPYAGYEKAKNAVEEATKCLATVQFHAASSNPKPPGLPEPGFAAPLRTPSIPHDEHSIAVANEYADYPVNAPTSPEGKGKQRETYSMDAAEPYGGIEQNPYASETTNGQQHIYGEFGGTRHVMFHDSNNDHPPASELAIPPAPGPSGTEHGEEKMHDYEYEQQKQMDAENAWKKLEAEEAAWKSQETTETSSNAHSPTETIPAAVPASAAQESGDMYAPWQPLNLKKENSIGSPTTLHDSPSPVAAAPSFASIPLDEPTNHGSVMTEVLSPSELVPPQPAWRAEASPTPGESEFHTPLSSPKPVRDSMSSNNASVDKEPAREYFPSNMGTGGKISAAAFRKGTKPKTSMGPEDSPNTSAGSSVISIGEVRRLPVPPLGPVDIELPASPAPGTTKHGNGYEHGMLASPPPVQY